MYRYGLCLSGVSAGVSGQVLAGFQAARRVEGAVHNVLTARNATRCAAFPLISDSFAEKRRCPNA